MSWGVWGVEVVPFVVDGEGVDPLDEFDFGGLVLFGYHFTWCDQ